ncbi:DUF397 domain-containing protein [Lentzea indica]|uniref:DUF397 domain-containing protein n=1 Tax=Lentzea indica TaxID=2604800 RepID=UPI0028ABB8D9|nr:DUF397 domain-containing protein [Lentzea indica]
MWIPEKAADLSNDADYAPSYSGSQENCAEVALTITHAGVRDSKHPTGPALSFSLSAFKAFLTRGSFSPNRVK